MAFTIEQFKDWVEQTFPDNIQRLIKENDLRDGLKLMAEYAAGQKQVMQDIEGRVI